MSSSQRGSWLALVDTCPQSKRVVVHQGSCPVTTDVPGLYTDMSLSVYIGTMYTDLGPYRLKCQLTWGLMPVLEFFFSNLGVGANVC